MPLIQTGRSFRIMGYDIPEYRSEPDGPYKLKPSGTVLGIEHAHNRGHANEVSSIQNYRAYNFFNAGINLWMEDTSLACDAADAMKISAGVLQLRQLRAQVFPAVNAQINKCIAL